MLLALSGGPDLVPQLLRRLGGDPSLPEVAGVEGGGFLKQSAIIKGVSLAYDRYDRRKPEIDDLEEDNLLWSAGFGLRFQLTRESPLNYRTDVGWGRDGFEFYFSLGEEF